MHRARAVDEDEREPVDKSLAAVDSGQVAGLQLSCGQANRSKKLRYLPVILKSIKKKTAGVEMGGIFEKQI